MKLLITLINTINFLEEFGGKILDSQMRGKRRLAYQIAKHREGIYVQLSHQGDGQHIFKIEKAMRLRRRCHKIFDC